MFNNKYLKQLQDIQAQIRTCTANINNSKPPAPDSIKIEADMLRWLQSLVYGNDPFVEDLVQSYCLRFKDETLDYLHKLGEYFINISDCCKAEQKYKAELMQLQKEERHLKEKLGID